VTSGPGDERAELHVRLMSRYIKLIHKLTDTITGKNDDLEADRKG
jgi:hypothetical protein